MAAWYQISKTSDGQFQFVLKAGNGETILTSERYKAMDSVHTGIASVQKNSPDAARYEKKEASNGKPYFLLKAANHQVIGNSQMYSSEDARDKGIASVQSNGPATTIKDTTAA
ncbi:YegP family protein [Luteimonas terricola]|uniref:DUF1508 domain-containing protein n=1 Tax=Luteimonas terricola TaxID=645597 RepID=A0ABQ2E5R5_9GAMM|nr:YegP family protein [Luteimonas terricola]GGJ97244.1 hypothetical protein GCM10011394_02680 [Luteimonas terricola]